MKQLPIADVDAPKTGSCFSCGKSRKVWPITVQGYPVKACRECHAKHAEMEANRPQGVEKRCGSCRYFKTITKGLSYFMGKYYKYGSCTFLPVPKKKPIWWSHYVEAFGDGARCRAYEEAP